MVKKAEKHEDAEPKVAKTKKAGTAKAKADKPKSDKPKRAYNIFIKDKIEELKKTHPDIDHKERFKQATQAWGEQKGK